MILEIEMVKQLNNISNLCAYVEYKDSQIYQVKLTDHSVMWMLLRLDSKFHSNSMRYWANSSMIEVGVTNSIRTRKITTIHMLVLTFPILENTRRRALLGLSHYTTSTLQCCSSSCFERGRSRDEERHSLFRTFKDYFCIQIEEEESFFIASLICSS